MSTKTIEVVVPTAFVGGWSKPDVTVHFKDEQGAMRAFREFADHHRQLGHEVTLSESGTVGSTFPTLDIKAEDHELTIFGPQYEPSEKGQLATSRPSADIAISIEEAIQRDDDKITEAGLEQDYEPTD